VYLSAGADVNLQRSYVGFPFLVDGGKADVLKVFIENGANVNAADTRGNRPLHEAVYRELAVVQLLV